MSEQKLTRDQLNRNIASLERNIGTVEWEIAQLKIKIKGYDSALKLMGLVNTAVWIPAGARVHNSPNDPSTQSLFTGAMFTSLLTLIPLICIYTAQNWKNELRVKSEMLEFYETQLDRLQQIGLNNSSQTQDNKIPYTPAFPFSTASRETSTSTTPLLPVTPEDISPPNSVLYTSS